MLPKQEDSHKIAKGHRKKIIIIATTAVLSLCIIVFAIIAGTLALSRNLKYTSAIDLMEAGEYDEAIASFAKLEDYKDSKSKIVECKYNNAVDLLNDGQLDKAYSIFIELGNYKDSIETAGNIRLTKAK